MKLKSTTRQLIIAAIYTIAVLCAIVGLGKSASSGDLSILEICLTSCGLTIWGMAETHRFSLKYAARKRKRAKKKQLPVPKDKQVKAHIERNFNAKLHLIASGTILVNNLIKLSNPTASVIMKIIGTLLWIKSAGLSYALAEKMREKDEHNISQVMICGMNKHKTKLIIETDYLGAATLFAASVFIEESIDPFKIPEIVCWIVSSLGDTLHSACHTYHHSNAETKSSSARTIIQLQQPHLEIAIEVIKPPRNDVVIEVLDEKSKPIDHKINHTNKIFAASTVVNIPLDQFQNENRDFSATNGMSTLLSSL